MRKFFSVLLLLMLSSVCFAQQADSSVVEENEEVTFFKPDNSAPLKFGLLLGMGYSGMAGTELKNPTGRVGINGSAYLRYRFKPKFSMQTSVGASYRGSNFSNSTSEYSSIRMYYLDVPVLASIAFDKTNNDLLILGLQYAYLLNSALYISTNALPENVSPSFNKNDISAVFGVQFNTPFVGFQILGKTGLTNINQNQPWPSGAQPANGGGSIHNFSIDLNLLF